MDTMKYVFKGSRSHVGSSSRRRTKEGNQGLKGLFIAYLYINLACLSVCLFVCLFVSNKRQNG